MASSSLAIPRESSDPLSHLATTTKRLSLPDRDTLHDAMDSSSDSDLSDVPENPAPSVVPPRLSEPSNPSADELDAAETPPSDDEDVGMVSEDGDFHADSPPRSVSAPRESRSASEESRRPQKRKVGIEDDEEIMNNPELYGIRRSGRARLTTRIIDSDSNEDVSDSDIQTNPRKRRKATSRQVSKPPSVSPRLSAGSDSGSDVYGTSRRKTGTKKHRRQHLSVNHDRPASHGEIRFSTRKAAKISNYNEDDSDDFEEDVEVLTPNYYGTAEVDNSPAIDAILNHRVREDVAKVPFSNPGRDDFEYFVKWQGRAHYHATWERNATLASCRGIRRLENYFRKIVLDDVHMHHDEDVPPEDKEKWSLDRERDIDALNDYCKVERVIGAWTNEDGSTDYLVKWRGLYYESCTWETSELVTTIAQPEIGRYLERTSKVPTSDKHESNPNTRSKWEKIREQPSYIKNGTLREFQITGLNFLAFNWCNSKNVILADEMGLGKTVQTVSFINWLRHDRNQQGPFIVVVPLSTMPSWAETFDYWAPDVNYVVYNGNEASRNIIKQYELMVNNSPAKAKFHVLLTTYEYILADATFLSQIKWQFMAVDEAHRLKNRESQLYAKLVDFRSPSRLLITGTPMQNTLGELSALMDFLMPGVVRIDENMDLQSEEAGKKLAELTAAISPYMLRRTKSKVENDLPPKTEKIIRVELSDVQLEYYKNILTRNYAALNAGAKGQKQSLLNVMMELKKASNHPFMFPNAEDRITSGSERREDILKGLITSSGKMMLLDRLLFKLQKDNHRVLIFSQMVKMLDILSDYLRLRGYQYQRLDGTIAAGPRRMAIDHFNAPESSDFCFLLSTRAGGLGINLMTADTVILFDSDWNPQADLQAMARAHRIGQTRPVTIYRLVSKETVEEEVLERARNKLMLEFITIQRGVTDKEAKEISDKMARVGKGVAEPNSSEDISRILKRRGQKMFEQSGNQKKLEELDIDSVLENAEEHQTDQPEGIAADGGEEFLRSFEYMDVKVDLEWDQIIPKDQLEEIKAEEKRKADEDYLAEVIEQNAPRKRKQADEEREQRAAKKRARELAVVDAAEESDVPIGKDPSRPLSEREVRNLIKGFQRYGSIDDRGDEVVQEARLQNRDRDLLRRTLDEIQDTAARLIHEEEERVEQYQRTTNKVITKKDRKAVLFDFRGVRRINAETIVDRPAEMRMLKQCVAACSDPLDFRVHGVEKDATYTTPWGMREDGMLCVGIVRHGYGAWAQIRDDTDLGLTDKFYLEEHRVEKKEERRIGEEKNAKSPGAVHLVRRADYLLQVLRAETSNGADRAAAKALENHHRNTKKAKAAAAAAAAAERGGSVSASPAPQSVRRPEKHRPRPSAERGLANGDPNRPRSSSQNANNVRRANHHHHTPSGASPNAHGHHHTPHRPHSSEHGSATNGDRVRKQEKDKVMLRMVFHSLSGNLDKVHGATKESIPDKKRRAEVLRQELTTIGDFIRDMVSKNTDGPEGQGGMDKVLWEHVTEYWPNRGTPSHSLRQMYLRIVHERLEKANLSGNDQKAASSNGDAAAPAPINGEALPKSPAVTPAIASPGAGSGARQEVNGEARTLATVADAMDTSA